MGKQKTRSEVADLIVRFIENRSSYPQEWNDFVECRHSDPAVEHVRKRCHDLIPSLIVMDHRIKTHLKRRERWPKDLSDRPNENEV